MPFLLIHYPTQIIENLQTLVCSDKWFRDQLMQCKKILNSILQRCNVHGSAMCTVHSATASIVFEDLLDRVKDRAYSIASARFAFRWVKIVLYEE